jgi:hypothetical protein
MSQCRVVERRGSTPAGRNDVVHLPRVTFTSQQAAEMAPDGVGIRLPLGKQTPAKLLRGAVVGTLVALSALPDLALVPLALDDATETSPTTTHATTTNGWGEAGL